MLSPGDTATSFDGSQVLFRLALASGRRAHCRLKQAHDQGQDPERLARAFDACIEAVVLAQASAESWIFWAHSQAGTQPAQGWRSAWNGISNVAAKRGRPAVSLRKATLAILDDLAVLRNYLVHGDAPSRARFLAQFEGKTIHEVLTVDRVEDMLRRMGGLWSEAGAITGLGTPFISSAWVSPDEFV